MKLQLKLGGKIMELIKKFLSKHKKAKPNVRRSVTRSRILERQKMQEHNMMMRREEKTKTRAEKVEHLGSNLIRAMEWGYMRKDLYRSTKHLSKEKKLEKQKEIAELWMEGQCRVKGVSL